MQSTIPAIDVINERIESLPINRAELARRAGMDGELLRRSLIGERKLVGDELVNICTVLDIGMDDFLAPSNAETSDDANQTNRDA